MCTLSPVRTLPSWLSAVPSKRGAAVPHTRFCAARRPRTSGGDPFVFQVRVRFRFCWIRNKFEFHYLFEYFSDLKSVLAFFAIC
jgi:hypothetical protein